jgi:hypothetical protein
VKEPVPHDIAPRITNWNAFEEINVTGAKRIQMKDGGSLLPADSVRGEVRWMRERGVSG